MRREALGQRQTRQRDAIFGVIQDAAGPLTVAEIHSRGQETVPGLGIATVYRTVKLLLEAQMIQSVILPSGEPRFEPVDRGHHHHFKCRSCEGVFDLEICPIDLPVDLSLPGGYQIEDHELTLFGTCPACVA